MNPPFLTTDSCSLALSHDYSASDRFPVIGEELCYGIMRGEELVNLALTDDPVECRDELRLLDIRNVSEVVPEHKAAMVIPAGCAPNFDVDAMHQRIMQLESVLGTAGKDQYSYRFHE
jgi:hypothetical protein